ncbi:glycosyltransferase family 9 protein [Desulfonatronum thioautotrophicum]|uniref:glycosyltransferase family 9 protein n=1 Tax=Desulfonatronum thioautotrophicum TaxID=617001 RepID=UPI000B027635|nr:glycosyltransferase family 9 protein [Desulfonatronum thioautotrophicum]
MAWPSLLRIREYFSGQRVFWGGPSSRLHWLLPWGIEPIAPELRRGVDSLFALDRWPDELEGIRVFWFALDAPPPVPASPRLHVLYGIGHSKEGKTSPRDAYARQLNTLGIPGEPTWLSIWREHFGVMDRPRSHGASEVLLFPGAGHPAKQWPLVQFFELAEWLQRRGQAVRFVLGPVEQERGVEVPGFPVSLPDSLEKLQDVLRNACFVVGNDSGPMHLAGMMGVPGLALFGPASEAQWGPIGLRTIALDLACRPCTQTGRMNCSDARCLREMPQAMVREEVEKFLAE